MQAHAESLCPVTQQQPAHGGWQQENDLIGEG